MSCFRGGMHDSAVQPRNEFLELLKIFTAGVFHPCSILPGKFHPCSSLQADTFHEGRSDGEEGKMSGH